MEKVCQVAIVHKEKVNVIKNKLDQKDFSNLLVLGKCFSDSSRIKIFYASAIHIFLKLSENLSMKS